MKLPTKCALSSLLRTLARLSTGPCWSLLGAGIPESGLLPVLHCYRIPTASYVPRFLLRCIAPTLVTKGNRRDPGIWYDYYVEHSSPIVFTPAPLVAPKHLHVLEWKGCSSAVVYFLQWYIYKSTCKFSFCLNRSFLETAFPLREVKSCISWSFTFFLVVHLIPVHSSQ